MITLFEYLQSNTLITDGATGTYYTELTGDAHGFCEFANLRQPEVVRQIHAEYIAAGAKLIRTNTFAANTRTLNISRSELGEILRQGYLLTQQAAAGHSVYIAANLGPIAEQLAPQGATSEQVLEEYRWMVDTFMDCGATVFNFETFHSPDYLPELSQYIKRRQPNAFIMALFTVNPDGFTRNGLRVERIVQQVREIKTIDAYGFNCGAGPSHLYRILKKLTFDVDRVAVLPNAGFPEIVNERTFYVQNPAYFAERIKQFHALGIKILGGCCGTTPAHIKAITQSTAQPTGSVPQTQPPAVQTAQVTPQTTNRLAERLQQGKFILATELDPPFDASIAKIMDRAQIYRDAGVDLITIADSPMAKPRADSIAISAKIKRELEIETLPHLCCRDRNSNALRSAVLGAHIEGIRNILAVTGDPLPHVSKNEIKSVFNLNSIELTGLLTELNREVFSAEPFLIGGALNLNVRHKDQELKRMAKKAEKGATLFLTQPIFDPEVIAFLAQMKKATGTKILGGLLPLVNYNHACFLKNEIPGMTLPDTLLQRFDPGMDRSTAEETGIQLAVEIGNQIKPYVDGLYLMTPFNRATMVVEILRRLKLI